MSKINMIETAAECNKKCVKGGRRSLEMQEVGAKRRLEISKKSLRLTMKLHEVSQPMPLMFEEEGVMGEAALMSTVSTSLLHM